MDKFEKIERSLEAERLALKAQLSAAGRGLAPERIVATATQYASDHGPEALAKAGAVARANKLPLAITGAGLGWLALKMLGQADHRDRVAYTTETHPTAEGLRDDPLEGPSFEARLQRAERAAPGRFGTETFEGETDMSTYSNTPSDEPATGIKGRAYASVEKLRAGIEDGLDGLPDGAKARIRAAREAAISAHSTFEEQRTAAAAKARQSAHDNPLLIGALAFAAGAAIAAALPRTSVENRTIGSHRDRLFDEAERMLRDETAKLKLAAEDTIAEGQQKAKEAVRDTAETARASVAEINRKSGGKTDAA